MKFAYLLLWYVLFIACGSEDKYRRYDFTFHDAIEIFFLNHPKVALERHILLNGSFIANRPKKNDTVFVIGYRAKGPEEKLINKIDYIEIPNVVFLNVLNDDTIIGIGQVPIKNDGRIGTIKLTQYGDSFYGHDSLFFIITKDKLEKFMIGKDIKCPINLKTVDFQKAETQIDNLRKIRNIIDRKQ